MWLGFCLLSAGELRRAELYSAGELRRAELYSAGELRRAELYSAGEPRGAGVSSAAELAISSAGKVGAGFPPVGGPRGAGDSSVGELVRAGFSDGTEESWVPWCWGTEDGG